VASFYQYPGYDTGLWTFHGVGGGPVTTKPAWRSGPGQWDTGRAKTVGGDFNGDGKADIAAFYEYADAQTKIYVFDDVNGPNVKPRLAWDSGKGNWAWSNGTTPLS